MDIDSGSSPDSTPSSKLQNASPSGSADRHPTSSTTTTTTAPLHSDSVPSAAGSVMAEHKEAVMAKDSPPDTHCRWGRTRKLRRVGKVGEDDDGNPLPGFEDVDDEQMAFCSESDFAIFIKQISSEIPLQRVWCRIAIPPLSLRKVAVPALAAVRSAKMRTLCGHGPRLRMSIAWSLTEPFLWR